MIAEADAANSGLRRAIIVLTAIGGGWVFEFIWSIAGVTLGHMQGAFSATPDQIAWVMTAFIMGSVITIACTGWLASRFGRKQIFLIALFGFGISLVMCGSATTIEEEVAWRLIQGLFGAPMLPLSQAITVDAFAPERHGSATAIWTLGIIGGSVLGPAAGGAIVEYMTWPWVFYFNIPLTVIVFIVALVVLPASEPEPDNQLDWSGLLAIIVCVTAFQIAFSRGERLDWFDSYEIIIEVGIGLLGLYYFVVHSLTTDHPFFRPALFRDFNYCLGLIAALANGAIATLPLVILPLMLEQVAGYPVLDTGILLLSRGGGLMIASALLARYDSYLPPKTVLVVSFVIALVSGYMMAEWTADVSTAEVLWINLVQGAAAGAIFIAINTLTFSTLPNHLKTEGFALYYTVLFTGATIGIAAIVAVLTRMNQVAHSVLSAHINPFNDRFRLLAIPDFWDPDELQGLIALEQEVMRQAEMIAYSDAFLAAAFISLIGIPLALMFRSQKPNSIVD
jgi:DHA2 family multidrug resistance protein